MAVEYFWRIPTHGDGRSVALAGWNRGDWTPATHRHITPNARSGFHDESTYADYLVQVARAAEVSGFDAHAEDPLANMYVSTDMFRELARRASQLAPTVGAVLEGGYNVRTLPDLVDAALEGFTSG